MDFSKVVEGLQHGGSFYRSEWLCRSNKPSFIVKEHHATIGGTSGTLCFNDSIRELLENSKKEVKYIVNVVGVSTWDNDVAYVANYVPTWEDIFADDWFEMF